MESGSRKTAYADVADILETLGETFASVHQEDVALQAAICVLVSNNEGALRFSKDLQHLDLITQLHADMARVLDVFVRQIHNGKIVQQELLEVLSLQSLRDCFEGKPTARSRQNPGDMTIF